MQIDIKGTNYDVTPEVTALVTKRMATLEKFFKSMPDAHVYVELEKVQPAQQNGPIWRTECMLQIPGEVLRAEATEHSFDTSVPKAVGDLSREIRKYKSKRNSLGKKGGAVLKAMLRGFRS